VGTAYTVTLAGSGGISPYIWALDSTSPALPCGFTMTAGVISGTPVASCAGTYAMVFDLTDSGTATALTAQASLSLVIAPAATITFGTAPTATGTYNVAYSSAVATSGGAGTLTYSLASGSSLPAGLSLKASTGAITGTPTTVGTFPFTVTAADAYLDSASHAYSITVNTAAQTITFANSGTQTVATPLTLSASSTSNLTVSFASETTSVCTVSGTIATMVTSGTCTIQATQAGNTDYAAATQVTQSFTVNGEAQTITFANPGAQTLDAPNLALTASSTSNLTVSFTSETTGVCQVSGTALTMTAIGTCTIEADQAGNTTYAAATPVTRSFTVSAKAQTINFDNPGPQYGGTQLTLSATASSNLTVSFASTTSSVCTVSDTTAIISTTGGTCTIVATQAGDSTYAAATSVSQSFTVEAVLGITTETTLPTGVAGTAYSATLTATGGLGTYNWSVASGSTLPSWLSFSSTTGATTTLIGTPTATASATSFTVQVSDGTHTASATFTVSVSNVAITTTTLSPSYAMVGSSYSATLAATGGSGTYNWSVASGSTLPSWLSFSSTTGATTTLTGTPTTATASATSFTVQATDANNSSFKATQSYTITAVNSALALIPNPSTLPSATVNQTYNGTITVSGGSGSYPSTSFQVNDGSGLQTVPSYQSGQLTLSSGFTLSMQSTNELIIGGKPTTATTLTLAVTATDSLGDTVSHTYTITVNQVATLTVTLNDVPQGMVGMPYTYNGVSANGGTGPYTITYTNPPAGLSEDSNSNLVGTPTAAATTTVTVNVTDSTTPTAQFGTATFSLTVVPETVVAHNSYLTGQYACYFNQYWDGGVTGGTGSTLYRGGGVFAIAVDGNGNITGGELDHNSPTSGYKRASTNSAASSTYAVGSDNRGYLSLTVGSSTTPVIFALAGGDLNSGGQFSEFAITEMDDAGTDPSGQHGSGHCYKQNTATAFTGTLPSGGYVYSLTGEDSGGSPESIVGSFQFTAGTGATTGTFTGVQDVVDNVRVTAAWSTTGTTAAADSYGRMEMTAAPSGQEAASTTVAYLTNNTKGETVLMGEQSHNGTNGAQFIIGEARKQVATVLTASNPFTGSGVLYSEGTNTENASGSTPTYEAQMTQFTGSSAKTITLNSMIENSNGKFKKDSSDSTGQSMTYVVDTTTGRVTINGQTGIYFYLYDTNSAAVIFDQVTSNNDGTSGTAVQSMTGWIEPQTAPTSGSWAIGDFATSYFMSKIENGDYSNDAQTSVLTLDISGNLGDYADDDGGWNWASWDEGMTGNNGTPETGALAPDTTDGTYGLFDVNFTESGTTTTQSYCFAISVDAATKSSAKGKLVCLDPGSNTPRLSIIQE
jgi:hypothetical protein